MKLTDPGAGLPREQAREARKAAWKRPTRKQDRDKLRADRVAAWEAMKDAKKTTAPH
jgi:hypothetical protein